jgi:ADP-ribosylglycohydrolase
MNPEWLIITAEDLRYEREQLRDEGKDLTSLADEFDELIAALDSDEFTIEKVEDRVDVVMSAVDETVFEEHKDRIHSLFDRAWNAPERDDYGYVEPSDWEGIVRERPAEGEQRNIGSSSLSSSDRFDHVHGAWLGRCAGCWLGKPVEGWTTEKMWSVFRDQNNYPLERYVEADVSQSVREEYDISPDGVFASAHTGDEAGMPEDDDTNYTVAGVDLLSTHGTDFESEDVARYWMRNVPLLRTHTAERVAYRNFANLVSPPESARHRNPYREWIGALIRADPYGYVSLGEPRAAAELAWRDARVSHVKNGIYGTMWVAAMLAAAPFVDDLREMIHVGLAEIPAESRLTEAVENVMAWRHEGCAYDEALSRLHDRWDETNYHHWCHTVSNAQIIAIGILWGDGKLGQSICRTVQAGFDTDSSGATVGSLVGMYNGAEDLPEEWVEPIDDTLESGIDGYHRVSLSNLAEMP